MKLLKPFFVPMTYVGIKIREQPNETAKTIDAVKTNSKFFLVPRFYMGTISKEMENEK